MRISEKKRFPLLPEALVPLDQMEQRMNQLENYMKAVLENGIYRNYSETVSVPICFIDF